MTKLNWTVRVALVLFVGAHIASSGLTLEAQSSLTDSDWIAYGSDWTSSKYAAVDQIRPGNVGDLEIVWRWTSPDEAILQAHPDLKTFVNEATPLKIGRVLYTSTSMSQVAAIDAVTGETIWVYDPKTWEDGTPANVGFVHRGVAYWEDGDDRRILYGTGDAYLIALNADTGEPISEFGEHGRVDLTKGLRRDVDRSLYALSSPPAICRDVVVAGSTVLDAFAVGRPPNAVMPPGDVRGFDVRTGEQKWTFHTIPQEGESGNDTWEGDSWQRTGSANVWTLMSADEDLGYVYLPVSTPTNDYYGGERKGANLFAESLVCLNAETGERVWHFQMVHHGLWDYDLPAAPNLIDITVDGKPIKAVAQVSKQAFCYVFDRVTGEPVWPIVEREVPQSKASGEQPSPTQPFPSKPAAFDRQGLTEDDLIDFTPELRQIAKQVIAAYDTGPLFSPPTARGVIQVPGLVGGASWAGAAVNPAGVIFVPSYTSPAILRLHERDPATGYAYTGSYEWGPTGPDDLPILKPPYGRITAIDLNTGKHLWVSAVGRGPIDHPLLKDLRNLPPLGWSRRVFPIATQHLLLAVQAGIAAEAVVSKRGNAMLFTSKTSEPYLFAFDPANGVQLARIELPASPFGAPMTYAVDGVQYVSIPIGGCDEPAELVTLALP